MPYDFYADQMMGSEYGGVQYQDRVIKNTVQPKIPDALSATEKLRLGYLTGAEGNSMSFEDLRQMVGLRHSDGRPSWFVYPQPFGPTYADVAEQLQEDIDQINWS